MAYYNSAYEGQQVQYQAPIVYYAAPAITYQHALTKQYGPYYKRETSTGLGATQIVLACISIAAGSMAIVYGAGWYNVGVGIWAGVWYLISGSLAIAAGKDPKNSLIKATLVSSVFDILLGVAQITIASFGLAEDMNCYGYYPYYNCNSWWGAAVAANSMMIGVGSLEIIFGFWLMVVSARAIDEGSKAQHTIVPVTYAPHQPQPVFMQAPPTSQPQPPFIQSQPPFLQSQTPFLQSQPPFLQSQTPFLQSQTPFLQSQPPFLQLQPPPYYVQQQYPSTSNQQQMMYAGVHQAPLTNTKH